MANYEMEGNDNPFDNHVPIFSQAEYGNLLSICCRLRDIDKANYDPNSPAWGFYKYRLLRYDNLIKKLELVMLEGGL